MKILFSNPMLHPEHKIVQDLQHKTLGVLFAENLPDAYDVLKVHGASIDLAIIHREGSTPDAGTQWIAKVKATPGLGDLPMILTTSEWDSAQCAEHQLSPNGVNAYLHYPFSSEHLWDLIQAVFGKDAFLNSTANTPSAITQEAPTESVSPTPEAGIPLLEETIEFADAGAKKVTTITLSHDFENQGGIDLQGGEPETLALATDENTSSVVTAARVSLDDVTHSSVDLTSLPLTSLTTEDPKAMGSGPDQTRPEFDATQLQDPHLPPLPTPEDEEIDAEIPYLRSRSEKPTRLPPNGGFLLSEPIGDAVVPGGAVDSPDSETLKRYLVLREQDVAILSNELKQWKDQLHKAEGVIREERTKNTQLEHHLSELQMKLDHSEREKKAAIDSLDEEIKDLQFKVKSKSDHVRLVENRLQESFLEMDHLKDRVRADIRKIRVREKELENKLEIMRKDSESLLVSRESKIIELKRKVDLLEFNLDLLHEQINKEKEQAVKLKDRLSQAVQIVRVAEGVLDANKKPSSMSEQKAASQ